MRIRLVGLSILLVFFRAAIAFAEPPKLADFLPSREGLAAAALPEEQYVEVTARRLAKAKVLWVNDDYFRELGFDVPLEGATPTFERQLLDVFGWGIKRKNDPWWAFKQESMTLFADRYGGAGLGENWGSGRAAAFLGKIRAQSKALGPTPLMQRKERDHSNGVGSQAESVLEAIWGEVNHHNLKLGSNRILMLIDRGTESVYGDGKKYRDVIMIREDPDARPAHFMQLPGGPSVAEWSQSTLGKREALSKFLASLPLNSMERNFSVRDQVRNGIRNYVRNTAELFARLFVGLKQYDGGTSPSNIELSGRLVDFGAQTAQASHGRVQNRIEFAPAGDTRDINSEMVEDFVAEARARFDLPESVISQKAMSSYFEEVYEETLRLEYIKLLGLPEQVAVRVFDAADPSLRNEANALADLLHEIATKGATTYLGRGVVPENVTRYLLEDIVAVLAGSLERGEVSNGQLRDALAIVMSDPEDFEKIERLVKSYRKILSSAQTLAEQTGISKENFVKFVGLSSAWRNRTTPGLYRWLNYAEFKNIELEYQKSNDPSATRAYIRSRIQAGITNFRGLEPWQTPTLSGETFDAREGRFERFPSPQLRRCDALFSSTAGS